MSQGNGALRLADTPGTIIPVPFCICPQSGQFRPAGKQGGFLAELKSAEAPAFLRTLPDGFSVEERNVSRSEPRKRRRAPRFRTAPGHGGAGSYYNHYPGLFFLN